MSTLEYQIKHMFPFSLDVVNKPYGDSDVVGRLHALQRSIPMNAYADLAAAARGSQAQLRALEPYFERAGCVSLQGKGEHGVAFRLCKSSNCKDCMLLKVVDTSRDKSGHPEDMFIEADVHDAVSRAFADKRSVAGYRVQPCIHFPRLEAFVIRAPYLFLFMEVIDGGQSLREAIRASMSSAQLKALMFQVLYTLACFQHEFPGFRHNDLHMGNVLVARHARPAVYLLEADGKHKFTLPKSSGTVRILDFGLSCSARFRNMVAEDMAHKGYGTQRCDMYDLHTLVEEMHDLRSLKSVQPFLAACERWIPARFYRNGPLFLQKHQRLSTRGQQELQALGGSPLRFLLEDAYFDSLRLPASSGAAPLYGYSFN